MKTVTFLSSDLLFFMNLAPFGRVPTFLELFISDVHHWRGAQPPPNNPTRYVKGIGKSRTIGGGGSKFWRDRWTSFMGSPLYEKLTHSNDTQKQEMCRFSILHTVVSLKYFLYSLNFTLSKQIRKTTKELHEILQKFIKFWESKQYFRPG